MSASWPYLVIAVCILHQLPAAESSQEGKAQCKKPTIDNMDPLSIDKEYYKEGEEVTVRCNTGYHPSSDTMRCDNPPAWTPPTVTCTAQCARPPIISNMQSHPEYKAYYNNGERITVRCNPGYYPSSDTMTCDSPRTPWEWSPYDVTCTALCRNPDRTKLKMDPDRTFYNIGNTVTVNCVDGYRPSPSSVQCEKRGTSIDWNPRPQCIAQCARPPIIPNMQRLPEYKAYYNKYDEITVRCNPGFYPSADTMRCYYPRTSREWIPLYVTCTAQCKKPTIDHMDRLSTDKEYYKEGEEVTVRCNTGYYPSSDTMRCDNPPAWTPPTITCTGVTMTDWRVTSTRISARISCTPDCPRTWTFNVQCCAMPYDYRTCEWSDDKSVTFTDLQPFTMYRISTTLYIDWKSYDVRSEDIRTLEESVPDQPVIVTVPSMEDNTIRWRLAEKSGNITGFQMNISVWRDYNQSFRVDESIQFPPNVTKYKIPLQHGTNYTITLRGVASSRAEMVTAWTTETDIGDPPRHQENTLREDSTLQLYPVPDVNGPISSYEIIVYMGQESDLSSNCIQYNSTPYNSSWTLSHYTAAVLPAETLTAPRPFILGDDQHYNGFHNAPLTPSHNYTVYIRVTSRWEMVEKSSCAFAGVISGVSTERTDDGSIIMLSHPSLGVIVTMINLTFLVLVGLCMIPLTLWMRNPPEKRRKKRRNNSIEDDNDDQEFYENPEEAQSTI